MKPQMAQGRSDIADVAWTSKLVEKRKLDDYAYFEMNTSALAVFIPGLTLAIASAFLTIPLPVKLVSLFFLVFGAGLLIMARRRRDQSPVVARSLEATVTAENGSFTVAAYHGRGSGPGGTAVPYPYMLTGTSAVLGSMTYPEDAVESELSASLDVFTATVVASELKDFFEVQARAFPKTKAPAW